jgi:hypothetical protein
VQVVNHLVCSVEKQGPPSLLRTSKQLWDMRERIKR